MANFGPVKTWGNEVLTPADLNAEILNIINNVTDGGINADNIDETDAYTWSGATTFTGTVTTGVDDTGVDVKFFGATTGKSWLWDESADTEILTGNSTISGTLGVTGVLTATAQSVHTGGLVSGSNIVSDADSTDDLGTTSARWANLYVDSIGDTGQALAFTSGTNNTTMTAAILALTGAQTVSSTLGVTGLVTATAGISSGSNIVSDTDSTDDLGTTGVRWANLYVDAIVATDTIAATSYTGALLTAVTAVTQSAGNNSTKVATTAYADAADVSLSGSTNNTIATVTGANALAGEANLTFDGSTLAATGAITATSDITGLTLNATSDTAASDNAAMGYTAAEGLILTGQGSTNDYTLKNDADLPVIVNPTGLETVRMGRLTSNATTGEHVALVLKNKQSGVTTDASVSLRFETVENDAIGQGSKITVGRQANYGIAGNISDYMAFWTINANTEAERMRIDSSGNVGIGTASPNADLHVQVGSERGITPNAVAATLYIEDGGTDTGMTIGSGNTNNGYIIFADTDNNAVGQIRYDHSGDWMGLFTGGAERMRISSVGVLTATSSGATAPHVLRNSSGDPHGVYIHFTGASPDSNTRYFLRGDDTTTTRFFIYSDGDIANHDGTYGTISDVKLKQDIVDARGYWDDFKLLQYRKFRHISDVEADPDAPYRLGLIAQEVETVFPALVPESPDADITETINVIETVLDDGGEPVLDADGNETTRVVMIPVVDEEGEPILDADGNETLEAKTEEVTTPSGTTHKWVKSSIIEGPIMASVVQELMARVEALEAA